jgi:cytochrome c
MRVKAFGLVAASFMATSAANAQTVPYPMAFAVCAGCHSTQPGKTMFGPSLAGLAGRKAGSVPGYAYSPALKASGLIWNAATLDRWLKSPQRLVPGTRMPSAGIQDAKARKAVIGYLLTAR